MEEQITRHSTKTQSKIKLFTRYFFIIAIVNVFAGVVLQIYNTTTSLYIQSLGGSSSFAGLCLTMITVSAMITRVLSGKLADAKGRRFAIILGLVIYAIASFSFRFFAFLEALPVLRFIQGIGYAMSTTALAVAIADVIPKERMGEGIGYYGLGQTVTTAIGPSIAVGLMVGGEFKYVFYFATGLLLIGSVLMLFCNYEKHPEFIKKKAEASSKESILPKDSSAATKASAKTTFTSFFEKTALPCSAISLVTAIATGSVLAFLIPYAVSIDIGNSGLYFTCSAIFMVLARIVTGKMTDRHPPILLLIPGFVMHILCFTLLFLASYAPVCYYLAGVCAGIAGGITTPVLNATVIKAAPDNRRGATSATYMMSLDVGIGIAGVFWGLVIDWMSYRAMFIGCVITIGIAIVLTVILIPKSAKSTANNQKNL